MSENSHPSEIGDLLDPSLLAELRRVELRSKRSIDSDVMGRYRSAFRGSGLIFSDLKEYQPGDEIKNIHWKVTARTGKAYVKTYDEDRQLNVLIAVDTSASLNFESIKNSRRVSLEFAALVATLAYKSQDATGLCLFSDKVQEFFPTKKSKSQYQSILYNILKKRSSEKATDIASALSYIQQHQRKTSVIFIVSDFLSPTYEDELRALSYKHDVICVYLGQKDLPKAGIVKYVDAESGEEFSLDTSHAPSRKAFIGERKKHLESLRETCKSIGADIIEAGDKPLTPLLELMRKRTARIR